MNNLDAYDEVPLDIDKELFLWSVISRRTDCSLLFWGRGKNKICKKDFLFIRNMDGNSCLGAALIATLIYRKRGLRFADQICLNAADEFEQLAIKILAKFYHNNA